MLNTILSFYLCFTYLGGIAFTFMMFSKDRQLTVGDLLLLLLSPFTVVPIVLVQIVSNFIDLDTVIIKDDEF